MKHLIRTKAAAVFLTSALAATLLIPTQASAGTDEYLGELMLVGYNFCPRGSIDAAGQLLPISQNTALFSLYGTIYGGDGRTTFGVPDLRGRAPLSTGQGPGLPNHALGSKGGVAGPITLSVAQMPQHNHLVGASDEIANKKGPGLDFLAKSATFDDAVYHNGPANKIMDPAMIGDTGGSQPVTTRGPYLTMRWCVVTEGVYPSRS